AFTDSKACRSGGACIGSNLKKVSCKSGHRFRDRSRVRMANGWALGKFGGEFRPGHADLRWAAPIWSISASLLSVHSFTQQSADNQYRDGRAAMYAERDGPTPTLVQHDHGVRERDDGGD